MPSSLEYTAAPTIARFMKSNAFGRLILGPVGSAKTTGCIMDLLGKACGQAPAPNGIRYTRFPVVRQTLKQLKDTVLKDVQQWLTVRGLGTWKVSDSTFYLNFENINSEWVFIPLEDAREQARLLSLQATGAWISEFTETNVDILGPLTGRLGRYPNSPDVGYCSWTGIIGDSNMPMEGTPWHHLLENLPSDWQKFNQPSGLDHPVYDVTGRQTGGAENLENLNQTADTRALPYNHPVRIAQGRKYYTRMEEQHGAESPFVIRYVKAEYGPDPSGSAVFANTFRKSFHVKYDDAQERATSLVPGYPLLIGQDFGRNPWSLICQVDHWGRLIIHEEVKGENVGLDKHLDYHLKPALFRSYLGYKVAVIGDPAGMGKDSIGEESAFDCLKRHGFPSYPAPTNNLEPRIRSVEALLLRSVNGGPGVLINGNQCPTLVAGMGGGYRFMKTTEGALKAQPNKSDVHGYSHVCDCAQYVSLVVHGQLMPSLVDYIWPRPKTGIKKIPSGAWT